MTLEPGRAEVRSRELPQRPGREGSEVLLGGRSWGTGPTEVTGHGHSDSAPGQPLPPRDGPSWGAVKRGLGRRPSGPVGSPGLDPPPRGPQAPGVLGGREPTVQLVAAAARQRGSGARWGGRSEADGVWAQTAASTLPHQGPHGELAGPETGLLAQPAVSPPGSPPDLSPPATSTRQGFSGSLSPKLPSLPPPSHTRRPTDCGSVRAGTESAFSRWVSPDLLPAS